MVKSKAQFRLMAALAHGAKLKNKPKGLSKEEAKEFISSTKMPFKKLPEKVNKKKRKFKTLS